MDPISPAPATRDELVETLARFAQATDERDWATIRALLHPGVVAYGRTGPDEVVAVMQEHLGGCGPTQHLLGNHQHVPDDERPRVRTAARVWHEGGGDLAGDFFECFGDYDETFARLGAAWLLVERRFDMRIQRGNRGVLRPAARG